MARIIRKNLGEMCFVWKKGNRVPFLGIVSYNPHLKAVIVHQKDGSSEVISSEDLSYIQRSY